MEDYGRRCRSIKAKTADSTAFMGSITDGMW
jgi:hypothetical protein